MGFVCGKGNNGLDFKDEQRMMLCFYGGVIGTVGFCLSYLTTL